MRAKNLKEQKFGKLLVIERFENRVDISGRTKVRWLCKCDCGKEIVVDSSSLLGENTKSCGCYQKQRVSETFLIDLAGQKFGRLVVKHNTGKKDNKRPLWHCICDCGNEIDVPSSRLLNGQTQSCGCYRKENSREKNFKDLTGKRFGRLIVIKEVKSRNQPSGQRKTTWLCKCDCGKEVKVLSTNLLRPHTFSCGCLDESSIASETKKYFAKNYEAKIEYRIFKNPDTNCFLPYDIYIPNGKDLKLNGIYIEINGTQHYKIHKFHRQQAKSKKTTPEKELKYQKRKDKLKKKFAKENGTYMEIDLREIKNTEEAIQYIEERL